MLFPIFMGVFLTGCAGLEAIVEPGEPATPEQIASAVADTLKGIEAETATPIVLATTDPISAVVADRLKNAGFTVAAGSNSRQAQRYLSYQITVLTYGFLLTVTLDGKQAVRLYGRNSKSRLDPNSAIMITERSAP